MAGPIEHNPESAEHLAIMKQGVAVFLRGRKNRVACKQLRGLMLPRYASNGFRQDLRKLGGPFSGGWRQSELAELLDRALDELRVEGKLLVEPIMSRHKKLNRKTREYAHYVLSYEYVWCDSLLDAIARVS